MPAVLRAGIVGAGFMGEVHARAVRNSGGVVSRVVGSTAQSSEDGARRLRAQGTSADVEALVRDPEVDVVHVCAPNWMHLDVSMLALDAGKPVICEKPLATTVADADKLANRARETGLVAVVPFVYRFHPMVREAQARIARGDLGTVSVLHGSYLQDWLSAPADTNWRVDPKLGGASRAFGDIGVHWCDLVEFVSGHRIAKIAARALTAYPSRGNGGAATATEDAVTMSFHTDRGAIGSLVVSQVSPGRKNRLWFSVDGSEASVSFNQETPDSLWLGKRDQVVSIARGADDATPEARRLSVLPAGHPQGYQDAFNALIQDAYAAVDGSAPDGLPTFEDGLRAARLTEAIMIAADSETWVDVA